MKNSFPLIKNECNLPTVNSGFDVKG